MTEVMNDDATGTGATDTGTTEELTADKAKDALYGTEEEANDTGEANDEADKDDAEDKGADEKSGEDKSGDGDDGEKDEKKADDADEPYELDDKELTLTAGVKEDLEAFGKENGIPKEKMLDIVKKVNDHQNAALAETAKGWHAEALADKEFGGEAYEASIKVAAKPLLKFGNEKVLDILEQTGLNVNPEVIRLFHNIGRAMGEGQSLDSSKSKGSTDMLTKLYGPPKTEK